MSLRLPTRARYLCPTLTAVAALTGAYALTLPGLPATPPAPAEAPHAAPSPPAAPPSGITLDLIGRTTPRGTVRGFLRATRNHDYAKAARYLDPEGAQDPSRPDLEAEEQARELKLVLDRALTLGTSDTLSNRPEGNTADGLAPDVEKVGEIASRAGKVEVLLRRVEEDGSPVWVFSHDTLRHLPQLYSQYGFGRLGELLPPFFFEWRFLEVQLWQWIALALLIGVAIVASWPLFALLRRVLLRLARHTSSTIDDDLIEASVAPLRLMLALGLFRSLLPLLGLAVPPSVTVGHVLTFTLLGAIVWLFVRLIDVGGRWSAERWRIAGNTAAVSVVPLVRRVAKILLFALAVVVALQNMGVQITGLLAGLGVGGIAVALAAQKTLENLFGGVSLIIDQPVRVGDFCRFGDKQGTIEDVGLRSTRVRTVERTLISVPNADFAAQQIENFGVRERVRFFATIGLRYDTTTDQLRYVLAGIRKLLLGHPRVDNDPARVRLVALGSHSLDVEIHAYVLTSQVDEFYAVREDLLLRIMDLVQEAGTGFAFPTNTTFIARDVPPDEARRDVVHAEVKRWREEQRLPFPGYTPDEIASFAGTVDYPPDGAPSPRPRVADEVPPGVL